MAKRKRAIYPKHTFLRIYTAEVEQLSVIFQMILMATESEEMFSFKQEEQSVSVIKQWCTLQMASAVEVALFSSARLAEDAKSSDVSIRSSATTRLTYTTLQCTRRRCLAKSTPALAAVVATRRRRWQASSYDTELMRPLGD